MTEASGEFTVAGGAGEETLANADRVRVTHAFGDQRFSGALDGTGHIDWLMCYRADRTAEFVGIQRIEATLEGRTGAFALRSVGSHDGRASRGTWTIVEASGSGGLEGISGEGDWTAGPGPTGSYRLRYEIGAG